MRVKPGPQPTGNAVSKALEIMEAEWGLAEF